MAKGKYSYKILIRFYSYKTREFHEYFLLRHIGQSFCTCIKRHHVYYVQLKFRKVDGLLEDVFYSSKNFVFMGINFFVENGLTQMKAMFLFHQKSQANLPCRYLWSFISLHLVYSLLLNPCLCSLFYLQFIICSSMKRPTQRRIRMIWFYHLKISVAKWE